MKKRPGIKLFWALMLGAFFCSGVFVFADGVFSSADLIESGGKSFSVIAVSKETEPEVHLSNSNSIQVPVSGGSVGVFSGGNATVKMEQHSSEILAIFEIRPKEGFQYRFKAGQIRDFDLQFSSGSQVNKLEATQDGFVWGAGLSGRIAAGSMVSVAISWSLDYTQTHVNLDRFQGGDVVYSSGQRWRQEEFEGNLNFSHRWKMIEPFGGLKVIRVKNRLVDETTKGKVSGANDVLSPFVGIQWNIAANESLSVGASFLDEKLFSAGFKFQF